MLTQLDERFAETLSGYVVLLPGARPGEAVRATDCQFWDCTEKAARLYGYPSAEGLRGQYKSLVVPPWEQNNSQYRATAVHLSIQPHANDETQGYLMRPDGEEVACHKEIVTQGGTSGRPVWHTRLTLCSQHIRKRYLQPQDCGVSRQDVVQYCGDQTAYSLHKGLQRLSLLDTIVPESFRLSKLEGCPGLLMRAAGKIFRLYRCVHCSALWFGQKGKASRPEECPKCRSETWWREGRGKDGGHRAP